MSRERFQFPVSSFQFSKHWKFAPHNFPTLGNSAASTLSTKSTLSTPAFAIAALFFAMLPMLSFAEKNVDATTAGALGDGTTLNTVAIQKMIDDCAANGGGTIRFSAGRYLTGSLVMKSHTTLKLEDGAILLGSGKGDDYPLVKARWEGVETNCHRALIWADHAEDVSITGSGLIEGNPTVGKLRSPRGAPVVEFYECGNVRVEGVTLKSTRMWTLHPTYCHDVRVSGVTFETSGANSDGIDPDSCQRVHIEGCTFTTGDDNIAIKSGKGAEGAKIARPCEDITITNCTFKKGYTSIAFGSELSGGIRRVRISNCTFRETVVAALQFKSRPGRGGYVEDVIAENLIAGPTPLLELTGSYSYNAGSDGIPGADGVTQFRNIRISDATVASKKFMTIKGPAEKPADGIQISRVTGTCKQASVIENARNVVLTDIHIEGISGPSLFTRNATGTGLENAAPLREEKSNTASSH